MVVLLTLHLLLVFIVTVESIIILPICQIFFIRIFLFLRNIAAYHMQVFCLHYMKKLKKAAPGNISRDCLILISFLSLPQCCQCSATAEYEKY